MRRFTMKINREMLPTILGLIIVVTLLCVPAWPQGFSVIYNFQNSPDGAVPLAGVTFDRHGNLYGTTQRGGRLECQLVGCGTVFELAPNGGGWIEQVLSRFEAQG